MGRDHGLTETDLDELAQYSTSEAFSEREKRVLRFAELVTDEPVAVPDELFEALKEEFSEQQLVELAAIAAWENYRARFNRAFDLEAQGFSDGARCPLPERQMDESLMRNEKQ